jgi:hypothetical protein
MGKTVTLSNAGSITLTVPSGLPANFICTIVQIGTGQVTIDTSGTTVNNIDGHTKLEGQHAAASLIYNSSNTYTLVGRTAA